MSDFYHFLLARINRAWQFATVATLLVLYAASATAQMSQTLTLEPGWNAVYLEIEPDQQDLAEVFNFVPDPDNGLPIDSVWRYLSLDGVTGLPSNPADGLAGIQGWRVYFPPTTPVDDLSDLFTMRANNAYLIHYVGATPTSLTLTGKPLLQRRRWSSNAYTLTGFNVDADAPPSFRSYFAGSSAHENTPIYDLGDDGIWRLVNRDQTIRPGRAYWVYTNGSSSYPGPLEVQLSPGFSDLDFGVASIGADLVVINRSSSSESVFLSRLPEQPLLPLYFDDREILSAVGEVWRPLAEAFTALTLAPGESQRLQLAPRRAEMVSERFEQVLVLTSTSGVRVLLPAAATQPGATSAVKMAGTGSPVLGKGLWSGFATIEEVDFSSVFEDASGVPRATGQPFYLRIILHVDDNLQPRLVSSVVQLFEPGDPNSSDQACANGQPVLITERERFGDYQGLLLRKNAFVGARLSTTAYDLGLSDDGTRKRFDVAMVADANDSHRYSYTIIHQSDDASNPFYHRFHPDHDNLDVDGLVPEVAEVPVIERTLALQFCPGSVLSGICSGAGVADPSRRLAGTFTDQLVRGLHDQPITSRGTFELQRVTADPYLNPAPLRDCP